VRTFGVPLQHTPLDETSLPVIITQLCSHLKQEPWMPADILEKKVELSKIEALKKRIETVQLPLKDQDPYVIAALLKRFFFELPDSLFMTSKYKYWIEALGTKHGGKVLGEHLLDWLVWGLLLKKKYRGIFFFCCKFFFPVFKNSSFHPKTLSDYVSW